MDTKEFRMEIVAKPVAENLAKKTTAPTPPSPAITPPKQPLTISLQPVELRAIQFAQSTAEMVPSAPDLTL